MTSLLRRVTAEALGTALLVAAVVGSGIMGERLAGGNVALALLANTFATGAALVVLIITFGPISGAHLNPAVTLASAMHGDTRWPDVPAYVGAQFIGAIFGTMLAHVMFALPLVSSYDVPRDGTGQLVSELVATFGLLCVIRGGAKKPTLAPFTIAAYIMSAYWFTASTSFANPAVTIARAATNTFAGIRIADVPGFILAQLAGMFVATILLRWLIPAPVKQGALP